MRITSLFEPHSLKFNVMSEFARLGQVVLSTPVPRTCAGPLLPEVLKLQLSIEPLGYVFDVELIHALSWLTTVELHQAAGNILDLLRLSIGAHQVYRPMYPNFPKQVIDAPDVELLVNAYLHYAGDWLGLRILPIYANLRPSAASLLEKHKPKQLTLVQPVEVQNLFERLLTANASLADDKKKLMLGLLAEFAVTDTDYLTATLAKVKIAQKETLALVGGYLLRNQRAVYDASGFAARASTVTDVLRLAVVASQDEALEAEVTLTRPVFGTLTRSMRKVLMAQLDGVKNKETALDEMFSRREQWLRLGERVHPGEFADRWFDAAEMFKKLRNKTIAVRWAGLVDAAMREKGIAVLELLKQRPGVFARKLHEVLRKTPVDLVDTVVTTFASVVVKVSTPVLLQMRQRMLNDLNPATTSRAFAPKAGSGRLWVQGALADLPAALIERIVAVTDEALIARFGALAPLGKVFIDPSLKKMTVPFGQRTAQKALKTFGRGSRIPLGDGDIFRAFLWWNESGLDKAGNPVTIGRTDLDLSCGVLNAKGEYLDHCSFTKLRTDGLTHSGDITSAPKGACEFVDINFKKLNEDAAYISLVTFAYTRQDFGDMPEAFMGWMHRAEGQSGNIFEASAVAQKIDLTTKGQLVLTGYIDVAAREFVWADLALTLPASGFNAIESCKHTVTALAPGVLQSLRPTLFDLAKLHTGGRGELVATAEEADYLFVSDAGALDNLKPGQRGVAAVEAERIAAELLA